ncbi:MAG: peptide chain release factor N(5)-glutamine methyltransferase, partial [Clostridia bacterium]|nr:peptide chain release factor N(5)-glutamine methyltransferase [Clostridia bacterium]
RTSIGGQAVLEGVMMKGSRSVATAVRSATGEITVENKYTKSAKERNWFLRLPFVRGVVNLVTQLFQGTGIMMRSAEVYGDFAEPSKFDKWMSDKLKINPMSIIMTFSVILGIAIAIGLFVFLPNFLAGLICDNIAVINASSLKSLWYSLIEGGIMLVIFISYILLVSIMKDIRRVFMYHGAEHKTIACYEHGLELTVENARTMKREHSRCGTTFLFFVIAVSIMVFVLINFMLEKCGLLVSTDTINANAAIVKIVNALIRLGFKLLFLPVVAAISYELLKLLAKSDRLIVRILRAPGMLLQKLTTREPDDDMLEVAIVAFKTVLEMEQNDNVPEQQYKISVPYGVARSRYEKLAPSADEADIDWLFVEIAGCKRSEVKDLKVLTKEQYDAGEIIAKKMATGLPFQYAVGYADFYGVKISVNQNVLIPRPETEELVEKAIGFVKEGASVLDLCTGSGAIATVIALKTGAKVVASDVSAPALDVARANALNNGVKIDFVLSNMFEKVEGKFDVIVSNPPYIPSKDIETLDAKVKNFEPRLALDGAEDGLKYYRIIAENLDEHLAEGGVLLMEFGIDQAEAIKGIFEEYDVEILKDIEGKDRIAVVKRS